MGSYKRAARPIVQRKLEEVLQIFRACASGWPSTPARCPAENSRWWRSRAA